MEWLSEGCQSVEGLIRTLLSACGERLDTKITSEDKMMVFVAEYAAYLINRMQVWKDGQTSYERRRGKRATDTAIEFGGKLLWKVRQGTSWRSFNLRWAYGVFACFKVIRGEIWVATRGDCRP